MANKVAGTVGIVAALNWEMEVFASWPSGQDRFMFETSGPGPEAAASGAERAVARGAACLVSWGTAGALQHAEPGDIVLADSVLCDSRRPFATDAALTGTLARAFRSIAPIHRGSLSSTSAPVTSVADKRAMAEATGAVAIDMETAAIADVASRSRLPLVVVRVVVDRADRAVPAAAIAGMDGTRTRPGRVLAGLLKSPAEIGGVIALGLAARRARRTLCACAPVLVSLVDQRAA